MRMVRRVRALKHGDRTCRVGPGGQRGANSPASTRMGSHSTR